MADFSELLAIADKYKKKSLELDLKAQQDIKQAYRKSAVSFIRVLSRVVRRNNSSTVEEILIRADVEKAFSEALVSARVQASKIVEQAFLDGVALGLAQAKEESSLYGIEEDLALDFPKSAYLDSLLSDITRHARQMEDAAIEAFYEAYKDDSFRNDPFKTTKQRRETSVNRSRLLASSVIRAIGPVSTRSSASATVAVQRGITEAHLFSYSEISKSKAVRKVWVANFSNPAKPPCPTCAALHGTEISLSQSFSASQTFSSSKPPAVYKDLQGPPRHPNCRCVVSILVGEVDFSKETSPAGLRAFATKESKKVPSSKGISSQQIRDMPKNKFDSFKSKLVSTVKSIFRRGFGG